MDEAYVSMTFHKLEAYQIKQLLDFALRMGEEFTIGFSEPIEYEMMDDEDE